MTANNNIQQSAEQKYAFRLDNLIKEHSAVQAEPWFNYSPNAICRINIYGNVVVSNRLFDRYFKKHPAQTIHQLFNYFPEELGSYQSFTCSLLSESSVLYKDFKAVVYQIEHSSETVYECVFTDITKHVEEKNKFEALRKEYAEVKDLARITTFVYNAKTNELRWDDRFKKLFNLTVSQLFDVNEFRSIIVEQDRDRVIQSIKEAQEKGVALNMTSYRILDGNGKIRHIYCRCHSRYDARGVYLGVDGWIQDLSELAQTKEHLMRQNNMSQLFFDLLPVAIFTKGADLKYIYGNKKFLEDVGLSSIEELMGKTDYEMPWADDSAEVMQEDDKDIIASSEELLDYQSVLTTAQGKSLWVKVRKAPLLNKEKKCIGVIGLYSDITAEKNQHAKLLLAYEKLKESDRLKTNLISNLSDKVRVPLNAIVGFVDMIGAQDLSPEDVRGFASQMQYHADGLEKMLSDIIDLSLIDANQLPLNIRPVFVQSVLKEQFSILQRKVQLLGISNVKLKLNLPNSTDCAVLCDKVRVRQVLNNLIENAFINTDYGKIEISLYFNANGNAIIQISDTGVGIPDGAAKGVFDRFSSYALSAKQNKGLGIGLNLSKSLVELMDGKIWFKNNDSGGASFFFSLPSRC